MQLPGIIAALAENRKGHNVSSDRFILPQAFSSQAVFFKDAHYDELSYCRHDERYFFRTDPFNTAYIFSCGTITEQSGVPSTGCEQKLKRQLPIFLAAC